MNKYEIIKKIEDFAPPETQEKWDCSGWLVETNKSDVSRVMLCLTVTENVVKQAVAQNCDMIISHHPLFFIPFKFFQRKGLIDIYCAHTNMDRTAGGTTDTLIKALGFNVGEAVDFVRYVSTEISLQKLLGCLSKISPNLRYTNPNSATFFKKIAFCAGSGSEFINEAYENGADAFVTGDLKFHTALDSPITVFDVGHFESEILILDVFSELLGGNIEIVRALECSPFKTI